LRGIYVLSDARHLAGFPQVKDEELNAPKNIGEAEIYVVPCVWQAYCMAPLSESLKKPHIRTLSDANDGSW
jgi:hypothetical protein